MKRNLFFYLSALWLIPLSTWAEKTNSSKIKVIVAGVVERPGEYEVSPEIEVEELLERAGAWKSVAARPKRQFLFRDGKVFFAKGRGRPQKRYFQEGDCLYVRHRIWFEDPPPPLTYLIFSKDSPSKLNAQQLAKHLSTHGTWRKNWAKPLGLFAEAPMPYIQGEELFQRWGKDQRSYFSLMLFDVSKEGLKNFSATTDELKTKLNNASRAIAITVTYNSPELYGEHLKLINSILKDVAKRSDTPLFTWYADNKKKRQLYETHWIKNQRGAQILRAKHP